MVARSTQDRAGLGLVDEVPHVFLNEEAVLLQLAPGLGDRLDVAVVVLVPLLERAARVAAGEALGLGARERDVLAVGLAAVGAAKVVAAQRPAAGGGRRRRHARHAYAGDLVAVLVHLRDEDRIRRASGHGRRVVVDD